MTLEIHILEYEILDRHIKFENEPFKFQNLAFKTTSTKWVIQINLPTNFDLNLVYLPCMGTYNIFGMGEMMDLKFSIFYMILNS